MTKTLSVRELQAQWPSYAVFARLVGVSEGAAQQWRRRDSIPPEYWPKVVKAANEQGLHNISIDALLAMRTERVA